VTKEHCAQFTTTVGNESDEDWKEKIMERKRREEGEDERGGGVKGWQSERGGGLVLCLRTSDLLPITFSMCSKHNRRSWRRVARPASAESNPSDLAAAVAWRFVNAPQMRRVRWRRCSSAGADAAIGNKEISRAPSSSRLLTRSQPLVQSVEESRRRMERRSCDRKATPSGAGHSAR